MLLRIQIELKKIFINTYKSMIEPEDK